MADAESKSSTSTIAIIIAVVAILGAVFFFFKYQQAQTASSELENELSMAMKKSEEREQEIDTATQEITQKAKQFGAGLIKTADEVNTILTSQESEIDALNEQTATLDHKTQCQQLLEVGPKNADTWYNAEYSENFQQNICKYVRDINRDLSTATKEGNADAIKALGQALEIAQPYYDNFESQCNDIYDTSTCEFTI